MRADSSLVAAGIDFPVELHDEEVVKGESDSYCVHYTTITIV